VNEALTVAEEFDARLDRRRGVGAVDGVVDAELAEPAYGRFPELIVVPVRPKLRRYWVERESGHGGGSAMT
jgi:hypothetical protein